MVRHLRLLLAAPRDAASLYVFRMLFGTVMAVSAVRFMGNGWVERMVGERTFYFKYWGFSWVAPLSVPGMYGVYALLAALGLAIALGYRYRQAIVLFFLLFSYAELTDLTNYLNHYYLVSLLGLLMSFLPLSAGWSLDARAGRVARAEALPAYMVYLLRFQVATVYTGAALAKCGTDWLLHGWPLNSWLMPQVDLPFVGPFLAMPAVSLVMSWIGMLHDFLVAPLLLWRRTRPWAYLGLLAFHTMTGMFFNIGVFPVLMPMAATLFFEPSWPRRLFLLVARSPGRVAGFGVPGIAASVQPAVRPLGSATTALLVAYGACQMLLPLRTHLYGGNVLWHEQGMRFSWRVMLRDKRGSVMYRVELPNGREQYVPPSRYLTAEQEREMSSQPDMILQLAHHIGSDYRARGLVPVAVRADAKVSLNGRSPVPMIDPQINLLTVSDGIARAAWILPAPSEPPPVLNEAPRVAWVKP